MNISSPSLVFNYNAGSCFFVGLLLHALFVNKAILEFTFLQCLHVYWDFSDPSYNTCLFEGLLLHELFFNIIGFGYLAPQYLQ